MSAPHVVVVDFGAGNLLSVCRALAHCGADIQLADTPAAVAAADRLVLPGVGAFGDAMAGLAGRGLVDAVKGFAETGRPFLGICVGMQMLFDESDEFGRHQGLGIVPGTVARIPAADAEGRPLRIPHIGWNRLEEASSWQGTPLAGTQPGASVYFVHSYAGTPADPAHRLADCVYGGHRIAAAVRKEAVIGCQFHPEKSGEVGLDILRGFLAL